MIRCSSITDMTDEDIAELRTDTVDMPYHDTWGWLIPSDFDSEQMLADLALYPLGITTLNHFGQDRLSLAWSRFPRGRSQAVMWDMAEAYIRLGCLPPYTLVLPDVLSTFGERSDVILRSMRRSLQIAGDGIEERLARLTNMELAAPEPEV